MSDPVSPNKSLIEMTNGTASGSWGTVLNASMIAIVDQALGSTTSISLSSSNVNLTTSQIQNLGLYFTGVLTGNINVTLPLNPNSTTNAVGGFFVVNNDTSGSFGVTVKTIATGSVGVAVPQGLRSIVYSNGTNVYFADDAQNSTQTYNGNPNGNVAGMAGSASTRADRIIDRTTNIEYLATTSGTASSTVWSANLPFSFASQGYLTASSDATNPVLTADSIGATTIYYTAFRGNLMFLYNGVSFVPVPITGGQMALALSGSSQAANGIYDVIGFLNGSTLTIGFSPAWATATAGSGARGTGAGTPQLSRINGVLVNTVQQTVNNGSTTYTVAANRGTYLGSVYIDSSAGQVTCHVNYGQSRKWGIWNAYNREPLAIIAGDSTASWSNTRATFGYTNLSANNYVAPFTGLAEEVVDVEYLQMVATQGSNAASAQIGLGLNTSASASGFQGQYRLTAQSQNGRSTLAAHYSVPRGLGANLVYAIAFAPTDASNLFGTEASMQVTAKWMG